VRRTTRSHEAADAHCAAVTDSYGGAQGGNSDPHLALIQALRAVALDPDIVDAHVQVGLNYTWLANGGQMGWREATRQARAALDRSLALAPNDPQVLGLRGRIEDLEMNYPAAEASFRESLAREPTLPRTSPIHGRLGSLALAQNHLGEALEHLRRALRIDDSNTMQHMIYAGVLGYTGEYSEAIRAADAGLGLEDSGSTYARLIIAKVAAHDALGERLQANAILDEALASVGSESKPVLAQTLASLGRTEEARQLLAVLEELERPPTALMVETYAQLRDDRAFDWMHKAIDRHDILITHTLRANPVYSELHEDPRWAEVMAHLEAEEAKARAGGGAPE
jgi:tetratricopeptide (TPR) repeat protein